MHPVELLLVGLGVGVTFGLFGAGGSAFATPVLALVGVPPVFAVAAPLPAMIPASVTGARRYLRSGLLDRRVAMLSVLGGIPGVVVGALASSMLGGARLLVLSGIMLLAIGVRILMPDAQGSIERGVARRNQSWLVIAAAFGVGLLTGLLANGGGFLLVPLFIIVFGLSASEAAGTSMVAVGALAVPTLLAHWALGHIDWPVAILFGIGLVPGSLLGASVSTRIPAAQARRAFGIMLVTFAAWFLATRVL